MHPLFVPEPVDPDTLAVAELAERIGDRAHEWVPKAPFRAHLLLVLAQTGLTWPILAQACDVPSGVLKSLVQSGRGKLRQVDAARLCSLDAPSVRQRMQQRCEPHDLRLVLSQLVSAGLDVPAIASTTRLDTWTVVGIINGQGGGAPTLALWRARAVLAATAVEPKIQHAIGTDCGRRVLAA